MSIFTQALAMLPAVAAFIVTLIAIADRRDAATLRDICDLHLETDRLSAEADELESSAA